MQVALGRQYQLEIQFKFGVFKPFRKLEIIDQVRKWPRLTRYLNPVAPSKLDKKAPVALQQNQLLRQCASGGLVLRQFKDNQAFVDMMSQEDLPSEFFDRLTGFDNLNLEERLQHIDNSDSDLELPESPDSALTTPPGMRTQPPVSKCVTCKGDVLSTFR